MKESITSQKIGSWDFWQIAESVLNKGKSTIPSLFNGPKVVYSQDGYKGHNKPRFIKGI